METKTIEIPSDAIAALEQGNKIGAIKCVCVAKGIDLKGSKDLIETYLRSNPELEQRFKAKQSENNYSGKLLLILIVIGLIAYVIFSRRLY